MSKNNKTSANKQGANKQGVNKQGANKQSDTQSKTKFRGELLKYTEHYCELENVRDKLARDGVAVIRGVLTPDEITQARDLKWKMMHELSNGKMTSTNPQSWGFLYELHPLHSMLIQHWGVSQSELAWHIRQAPGVAPVFSKIWDDTPPEDLITSFDGLSIHLPPEITKRGWYHGSIWLHTDQAPGRPNLECIQGLVNLYDVRAGDATLKVLKGSHNYIAEYATIFNRTQDMDDWNRMNSTEIEWFRQRGCTEENILANAGDLVLWDSRVCHQGMEPLHCRPQPNTRCVVYVCMLPRSTATPRILQKRIDAYVTNRATTHWPNKAKLFARTPQTYGAALPQVGELTPPQITPLGRRLIGYDA